MKRIHLSGKKPIGILIAACCITGAIAMGAYVNYQTSAYPSSDNGSIDAELVHMASTVGGRLIDLRVHVNQSVHRGDILYRLDPVPYELTVKQAEANLALAHATVENERRLVTVRAGSAAIAEQQTIRARTNRDLAARTESRLKPLADHAYIPWQQYDQAKTALHNASVSLSEAEQQQASAQTAIGDLNSSLAAEQASAVALEHARYALSQTIVRAPTDGYVTSLTVQEGEVLAPSQVLFTLIANDEWYATAALREGTLGPVHIGDCATVYSMLDRATPLRGHVESIGWGVLSGDSIGISRSLPFVPRQMDWVHVAQRFPVRIRLDPANPVLLRLGATASVQIRHGAACH